MVVFRDLKSVIEMVIDREEILSAFYSAAQKTVTDKECLQAIDILRDRHEQNLKILRDIRIENFGKDEWIRNIPDLDIHGVLPPTAILGTISRDELASAVLEFETCMREFYRTVSEEIVTTEEKDLFDSLVMFKDKQIMDIRRCFEC